MSVEARGISDGLPDRPVAEMSPVMRLAFGLAALSLVGCGRGPNVPVQDTARAIAVLERALGACSAGLTPSGAIDQRAMAASGWRVVSRSARTWTENRPLPVDAFPTLRPGEYETTEWRLDGSPSPLFGTRWHASSPEHDSCAVGARTESRATADQVVSALTRRFGRPPDRAGPLPLGGDFLTPRFDSERYGRYWALPRNDVYVTTGDDGYVSLEVVAMPNRAALDPHSPDNPERRVPTLEGPG
jgi:hypothetical protein